MKKKCCGSPIGMWKSSSRKSSKRRSKSRSKSRKTSSLVRIPLKKGLLTKYNYSIYNTDKSRHESLQKAVKEYGALSVFRKINALYILSRNINPVLAQKYTKDRNWIKKKYGL